MAKIALLIGVSEYEPGLDLLPAAVKDIAAMQRVLLDPEMGGFDEAKPLANPDPQAMQYEIETLFSGCTKDDLVLLFFSGHGIKDDSGRLYFASRITQKNPEGDLIRSTAVPTSFVHDIMNNSRCKRQAIILDCCFSGAFDPALRPKDDGSVDLKRQLGAEGRVVLTSSSSTEYSFEQQGSDLSIYTRYLVEGIETGAGDCNEDGFVSVLELHEYAASKVQETAPKMTPQIIVMKGKGFDIVLAKARVTDPKLKYRKAALRYANAGTIPPRGQAILKILRQQLGLTLEESAEIETEVLRPYQERLANLQQYRETLVAEAEHEYPLSEFAREDLNTLQQMFGLRDEDVLPIQQAVEAQFARQSAAYQQNLVQYEQALTTAIQREFPFSQQTRQELGNLQQSLGLMDKDVERVRYLLVQAAEVRHQETLRQEADRQRQEQERAEYENRLGRYEEEFTKATQQQYPLEEETRLNLQQRQQQLNLSDEDVEPIKTSIKTDIEAHLQKLEQYQQALSASIQFGYPLSEPTREEIQRFQQVLELSDEDAIRIEAQILASQAMETPVDEPVVELPLEPETVAILTHNELTTEDSFIELSSEPRQSSESLTVAEPESQVREAKTEPKIAPLLKPVPKLIFKPRLPKTMVLAGVGVAIVGLCGITALVINGQSRQAEESAIQSIKDLKAAIKYDDCVSAAQAIKQDSRIYADAQALLNECQTANAQATLIKAKQLAKDSKFKEAITEAGKIPASVSIASEAKKMVGQWSESLLQQATKRYKAGKLEEATADVQVIPADSPTGKKAQQQVGQWKNEWSANDTNLKVAQKAFDQSKWQSAIDAANKVTNHPFWQSKIMLIVQKAEAQIAASKPSTQTQPEQPYIAPTQPEQPYIAPTQPEQPYIAPTQPEQPYIAPTQPQSTRNSQCDSGEPLPFDVQQKLGC
ncbi:MAG: caspase family protein [Stenomitos frigidus ULC029]